MHHVGLHLWTGTEPSGTKLIALVIMPKMLFPHQNHHKVQFCLTICLYCLKWTKFGKYFPRKLIKIDATRCLDFSSKCTKMRLAALERSPRPPSRKKGGLLLRGGGGRGGKKGAYF